MKRILILLLFFSSLAYGQDGGLKTLTASGTNTYTISEALPASYDPKERFLVRFTNGNSGAATLNRATLGVKALQKAGAVALSSGDIVAGGTYLLSYNGTYYQIVGTSDVTSRVYNVKSYGALGNGKSTTAIISSGSTTLTSYASIFSAGDVGKTVSIATAGASNDELVTTITGYTSPTQVTINTATSSALAQIAVYGTTNEQVKGRVVAGSLNTFTALSSTFSAGDVGKSITLQYLGNASGTLSLTTTIATYVSPMVVTLTVAATIPTSVIIFFGTDDTAAIQSTINAAFNAGGGNVYFPNGNYIIASNLVTSDINGLNPNSQLYIPASATTLTSVRPRQIKFIGESYSTTAYEVDGINNFGVKLVALKSKGTGTLPSVIGGIGTLGNNPIDYWNATTTYWEHMSIVMSCNNGFGSNMIGLNATDWVNVNATNFHVYSTFHLYSLHYTNPLGTGFTGVVLGGRDNNASNIWQNCLVGGGFEYGYVIGEHVYLSGLTTGSCYYGFTFTDTNFLVTGTLNGAFNRHDIYFPDVSTPFEVTPGTAFVDVTLENESSGISGASNWVFTNGNSIIKDVSNYGRGIIKYNGQNGLTVLTKIGATNLYTPSISEINQKLTANYPPENLNAHFDFNEGSGNFHSMGTYGYTSSLTPNGSVNRVTGVVSGGGNAVQFPAGTNFLEGSNSNSLSAGKEFSISYWVRKDAFTNNLASVVSKYVAAGNYEWAFYYQNNMIQFATSYDGTNANTEVITPANVLDGVWHFITATWDGTKLSMYFDGQLNDTAPVNNIFNSGTANLTLSKDLFGAGTNFRGTIDELSIRQKHLTSNEIAYLYNAGLGRLRPATVNEPVTAWTQPRTFISNSIGLSGANYGTSGQVVTSQGSASAPIWSSRFSLLSDNVTLGGGATSSELRFLEPSGSGSNYFSIKAPALAVDNPYTWADAYPAVSGYVLSSTTAGVMSWANDIVGSSTNDAASAGYKGEEFNSTVSTYTNFTTTATYKNITSITLTAGDWDLSAFFTYSSNSATITAASNAIFVISTTTASAAGATEGMNISYIAQAALIGTSLFSNSISPYRVSISGTTTYYLNAQATFTLGNPQYAGRIRARRIR